MAKRQLLPHVRLKLNVSPIGESTLNWVMWAHAYRESGIRFDFDDIFGDFSLDTDRVRIHLLW